MKTGTALALLLGLYTLTARAQHSFYAYLDAGTYGVGFADTLIMNEQVSYTGFGYSGPSPLFASIWFPVPQDQNATPLPFDEFRTRTLPPELKDVYRELVARSDTAFIAYNIAYPLDSDEKIDYKGISLTSVLNAVQSMPTRSMRMPLPKSGNFPVIVYHHGAQGTAEENYVLAEYFASRGYIVVSANFHLPYAGMDIGATPFLSDKVLSNDQSHHRRLLSFARNLAGEHPVFSIGHSWGAQSGWCLLHEKGLADAFVSEETTIEFKENPEVVRDRWPEVYRVLKEEHHPMNIPVLLMANTLQDSPFHFFEGAGDTLMIHVSQKEEFAHDAYNSVFLMRYFFQDRFPQHDHLQLKKQLDYYVLQLELIRDFFSSVLQKSGFPREKYTEKFFIH